MRDLLSIKRESHENTTTIRGLIRGHDIQIARKKGQNFMDLYTGKIDGSSLRSEDAQNVYTKMMGAVTVLSIVTDGPMNSHLRQEVSELATHQALADILGPESELEPKIE